MSKGDQFPSKRTEGSRAIARLARLRAPLNTAAFPVRGGRVEGQGLQYTARPPWTFPHRTGVAPAAPAPPHSPRGPRTVDSRVGSRSRSATASTTFESFQHAVRTPRATSICLLRILLCAVPRHAAVPDLGPDVAPRHRGQHSQTSELRAHGRRRPGAGRVPRPTELSTTRDASNAAVLSEAPLFTPPNQHDAASPRLRRSFRMKHD